MSDIVERLRAGEPCEEEGGCACQVEKRNAASGCLCAVAADTITALRAENEKLRAALEGYACTCTGGECAEQAGYRDECGKPARAALEGKQ